MAKGGVKLGSNSERPRRILELLASIGMTRREISETLGISVGSHITKDGLEEQGYIVRIHNGKYAITDAGRKALADSVSQ